MEQWERATTGLRPPFAVVDLDAFDVNADDLVRRAGGLPIRVASKSVRCRALLERVLARPGFHGVMAYSVREAQWLVGHGRTDVFVAYPSVDLGVLDEIVAQEDLAAQITVCVDSVEHVTHLARLTGPYRLRVAIDVDASLRVGGAHLGVRRSPLREPADVAAVCGAAQDSGRLTVVGLMFYDAQIAGLPDSSHKIRMMKRASAASLLKRRRAVVEAVASHADLEFVNGGGTGSLEVTGADPVITELAAGSGLYGPTLFDGYDAFTPRPAAAFALEVVRRPAPDWVTLFSGGYIASGPTGSTRQPSILAPAGLTLTDTEGAGEVQTPVRVPTSLRLELGDRVWLRHAKAGELCERFDVLHLIKDGEVVDTVPTYRGEAQNFG